MLLITSDFNHEHTFIGSIPWVLLYIADMHQLTSAVYRKALPDRNWLSTYAKKSGFLDK
jgi:hypothetical protein